MAAIYLVASLGVMPTPAIVARWLGVAISTVEGAERYPCEKHACGCVSALECWSNCCCHTPRQRLVWAITHGVQPPDSVKFSDDQWIAASNDVKAGSAECSACVAQIHNRLARGIATTPDVPAAENCSACPSESNAAKPASPTGLTISALACKGIQQILAVSVPPSIPSSARTVIPIRVFARAVLPPQDAGPESPSLDVPEPPPRLARHA